MIPFNVPPYIGKEDKYIKQAIDSRKICGDGQFTKKCNEKFEEITGAKKVLMTTSGTSALEMAALLADIKPGDEVIMPSYTFVSTANAFVLRGATIVFVDIRPDTMNIDENLIEDAINERNSFYSEDTGVDLCPVIKAVLFMEAPRKVVKEGLIEYPKGKDWEVVKENQKPKNQPDPRLAKFKEFKPD